MSTILMNLPARYQPVYSMPLMRTRERGGWRLMFIENVGDLGRVSMDEIEKSCGWRIT